MKLIVVFGSTGMLGRYISSYFNTTIEKDKFNWKIICITRKEYDILDDNYKNIYQCKLKMLLDKIKNKYNVDDIIVINAIGLIPQTKNHKVHDYFKINTVFPHVLDKLYNIFKYKLIHITTDCVYDGSLGFYNEKSPHTETNIYGTSKSLGDALQNACIIRTSIIGEQDPSCNYKSLLDWVRNNNNKTISGYKNHIWNGMTCLKLSQIIFIIIKQDLYWKGIRHLFNNKVTKYDLINMIIKIYKLNIEVIDIEHTVNTDKTLSTLYTTNNILNLLSYNDNTLYDQIASQKSFNINRNKNN